MSNAKLRLSSDFKKHAAAAKSLQLCPTLCDPIDGSPLGSAVPEILQARTLEWVAISFSNAWKWKVKVKSLSRVWPSATPWTAAYQAPPSMGFPGKSTGVGCHCLLRNGILLCQKKEHIWISSNVVDEPRAYYTECSLTRLLCPWDSPGKIGRASCRERV